MIRTKILVATHKEFPVPQDNVFLPIQVGRKTTTKKINILGDDSGDNISERNQQYCELTAIYWAWKNLKDFDYIGLCHYRRYPTFDKINFLNYFERQLKYYYSKYIRIFYTHGQNYIYWPSLEEKITGSTSKIFDNYSNKLNRIINKYEIITLTPIKLSNLNIEIYWSMTISIIVMNNLEIIIRDQYPIILNSYLKLIKNNKISPCNIFIFNKSLFGEYCDFIFTILQKLEQLLSEIKITPLPRTMGYVGEVLTSTFILYKQDAGSKIKYLNLVNLVQE